MEVGDATDVETVLDVIHEVEGPVYVRMLRGEIPRLFSPAEPLKIGQARILTRGSDVTLFSSGICTEEAMRATSALRERGVRIQHLHVSTHKPFGNPELLEAAAQARFGVITMENHTVLGGLGTAVAEMMAEAGVGTRLTRIGLQDTFIHGASRAFLMHEYGLDAIALVKKVEELVGTNLGITENDLAAVRLEAAHSEAKAESL